MKKFWLLLAAALMVSAALFAQNQEREMRRPPESVTVEGTLQLQNGFIAVASGDTVYYVGILQRYIGFIEGLKEGNAVTIEGFVRKNFLRPVKVTLNGKTYDFPVFDFAQRPGQWPGGRPPYRYGNNNRYGNGCMAPHNTMPPMHRQGPAHRQPPRSLSDL